MKQNPDEEVVEVGGGDVLNSCNWGADNATNSYCVLLNDGALFFFCYEKK